MYNLKQVHFILNPNKKPPENKDLDCYTLYLERSHEGKRPSLLQHLTQIVVFV